MDSDGNRLVNGVNQGNFVASPVVAQIPNAQPVNAKTQSTNNVNLPPRPDWETKPANTGAYVPDNRGKYKGN